MTLHISSKNLGSLQLPEFCALCFWFLTHLSGAAPFTGFFPALLYFMEDIERKAISAYYAETGNFPSWFGPFSYASKILPSPGKLSYYDPDHDVELVGIPDELFECPDGSTLILDYKTSMHKGKQDQLFALYDAQVNAYAFLAERQQNPWDVSAVGLLHFEIDREAEPETTLERLSDKGILAAFSAVPVQVKLRADRLIPTLIAEAKEIYDSPLPPLGREGCKDCRQLARLVALVEGAQQATLAASAIDRKSFCRELANRQYQQLTYASARSERLRDQLEDCSNASPAQSGVWGNWDFTGEE